jgi:stage V sporulation protein R
MQKMFEVRKVHNDITFIDEFFTYDFVREQKLFSFGYNPHHRRFEIESRQFNEVKQKLLAQITNVGQPIIRLADANHENRGDLLLQHQHDGVDLDPAYARETLKNLYSIWKRPCGILTKGENKPLIAKFDGHTYKEEPISEDQAPKQEKHDKNR